MALCYENCRDDYSFILGVCYEECDSGDTDLGLTCWGGFLHWYAKSSYIPGSKTNFEIDCPSGQYRELALCYRDCGNIGMENCGIGACARED